MGWSLTQFLSPSTFPLSTEHPHAQKRAWLTGWGRRRETLKLIKRFSKAICFPLGLRFDNQTNSLPSAPLTSIFTTSIFITINYLLSSDRTCRMALVSKQLPDFACFVGPSRRSMQRRTVSLWSSPPRRT